jgi:hypothetical protein
MPLIHTRPLHIKEKTKVQFMMKVALLDDSFVLFPLAYC